MPEFRWNGEISMRESIICKTGIIIELYNSGKSALEISKIVNHDRQTIKRLLIKNNINVRNRQTCNLPLEEKINQIIPLYQKNGKLDHVAKEIGVSRWFVTKFLRANNIKLSEHPGRKYDINDNFFEKIDNEANAYFLGLIAADGHIGIYGGSETLVVGLIKDDIKILEIMRSRMNAGNPVRTYERKDQRDFSMFSVVSSKIYNDLTKLNITPRKSLTLEFPNFDQVPENLIHHFIRGYFDGDGCITRHINRCRNKEYFYPCIKICGTREFLESLRIIFQNYGITCGRKLCKRHKNDTNMYSLDFSGYKAVDIFYNNIFKDATIFLDRKKSKIESYFK